MSSVKKTGKKVFILFVAIVLIVSVYTYFVGAAVDDNYTVSLLHFEGTDGSTTITDESGKTWITNGSAQLSLAQKKFGDSSLYTNQYSYIETSDVSDAILGNNDFTIDLWCYMTSNGYMYQNIFTFDPKFSIWIGSYNGNAEVILGNGSTWDVYLHTDVPLLNSWHHLALVRSGGKYILFVDGINKAESTAVRSFTGMTKMLLGYDNHGEQYWRGYIDEFRLSNGIARWTENFTPPDSPNNPTPTPTPTVTPTPTIVPTPTPSSNPNYALLEITMVSGEEKEFDLPMTEVENFMTWYNNKGSGVTGISPTYEINKTYNKGPFISRKEYIVFDKIASFEVMEYTPQVSTQ